MRAPTLCLGALALGLARAWKWPECVSERDRPNAACQDALANLISGAGQLLPGDDRQTLRAGGQDVLPRVAGRHNYRSVGYPDRLQQLWRRREQCQLGLLVHHVRAEHDDDPLHY